MVQIRRKEEKVYPTEDCTEFMCETCDDKDVCLHEKPTED
jgi:hypothetical protein